ncbi:lipoprotein, partial [Rhodocaloribacter sp.]
MKKLFYLAGLLLLLAACSTGVVSPKTGAPGSNDGAPAVDVTKQYVLG